jgi:DNA-binding NarL/FixJ family response regulator
MTTRILLVDDHPVVREGLAAILASEPDFEVVGQASSGEQGLKLATTTPADVIVVDVRLGRMSGIELCAALRERNSRLRVIVLTSFPNEGVMLEALTAGARAFLVKESDPSILREAVRTVLGGGTFIDPRVAAKLVTLATKGRRAKGPFGLTMQEMRVLELLPRGFTNKEIGRELGVSEQTVKTHLSNAMRKLNVNDRAQAAAVVMREGLG